MGPEVSTYRPANYSLSPGIAGFEDLGSGGFVLLFGNFRPPPPGPVRSPTVTVLVLGPKERERVDDFVWKRIAPSLFGLPKPASTKSYGARDGKVDLCFYQGSFAEEVAHEAHVTLPSGGCIVTLTEPPDWLTARLDAVLHFLHVQ